MAFLDILKGGSHTQNVKQFQPLVGKINALESSIQALSDTELKAKTVEFRGRLANKESLDDILPEAFAVVREASRRTLGQRHFDVQLIGGMVLNVGGIAEMRTGEGKTLVATLPAYLNALTGKGVHVVTVNDYLSRRDAVWMGQIYDFLGLSVGVIGAESSFLYDPAHKSSVKVTSAVPAGESDLSTSTGGRTKRDTLSLRGDGDISLDVEETIDLNEQETLIEPTRLYTHNIDVDTVNDRELGKVQAHECIYEMTSKGRKPLVETLKKSCLAPEKLRLKKGARVMCVKNNFEKGYVNGTLGVIVSCGHGVDPVIRAAATPDFPEGRLLTIELATWQIEDDGKVLAEIHQYPLRLAWAITVHKSQGMSLDAIEVDLSRSFEAGMGYVALSRVRTLAGLRILGLNQHALKVNHEVLEYDHHLRELSAKAESIITHTDEKEIIRAQESFLGKVAPMHTYVDPDTGKTMTKRNRKVKAPKPPKISTFAQTAKLIRAQKNLQEIAGARDMLAETIIAHLEYLTTTDGSNPDEHLTRSDIAYLKYEISPQHFGKIEKALEEVSLAQGEDTTPFLSPVKTKVGAGISFKDIRLARVLLGYFKKIEEKKKEEPY